MDNKLMTWDYDKGRGVLDDDESRRGTTTKGSRRVDETTTSFYACQIV
jgi:hypothetical protein